MRTARLGWDMTYSGPMSFVVYFLQEEASRRARIQQHWDLRRAQRFAQTLDARISHTIRATAGKRL